MPVATADAKVYVAHSVELTFVLYISLSSKRTFNLGQEPPAGEPRATMTKVQDAESENLNAQVATPFCRRAQMLPVALPCRTSQKFAAPTVTGSAVAVVQIRTASHDAAMGIRIPSIKIS
jgi:hypothetical protein